VRNLKKRKRHLLYGIIIFNLLIFGCAHPPCYLDKKEMARVKKVAIFPFRNLTQNPHAREIVTQIFLAELGKSERFKVEELGNIIDFMVEQRLRIGTSLDKPRLRVLRKRYKIDAVILGSILDFGERGGVPYVNLTARMVTTDTGKIIWKACIERNGDDYIKILDIGKIRSLNQLASVVVEELINSMG